MAAGGTFVYVSNADSKDILVLNLDLASGALSQVQRVELSFAGLAGPARGESRQTVHVFGAARGSSTRSHPSPSTS